MFVTSIAITKACCHCYCYCSYCCIFCHQHHHLHFHLSHQSHHHCHHHCCMPHCFHIHCHHCHHLSSPLMHSLSLSHNWCYPCHHYHCGHFCMSLLIAIIRILWCHDCQANYHPYLLWEDHKNDGQCSFYLKDLIFT